jgi:hypothetical protein
MPNTCEHISCPFFFRTQKDYIKQTLNSMKFPKKFYSLVKQDDLFLHTLQQEKQTKTLYIPYLFNNISIYIKFFNLLNQSLQKRDFKLIGVRPISKHYLNLYSKELIKKRIKTKPCLLPTYYAELSSNINEIQESKFKYFEAYFKNPFATNTKYFFKIVFRKVRSK